MILAACGGSAIPPLPASNDPSLTVGETSGYNLYTHCGVLSATANGHTYFAEPPLSDGSGNPPPGWGNPFDGGSLTMVDTHHVEFRDPTGHVARFTDAPAGPTSVVPLCS